MCIFYVCVATCMCVYLRRNRRGGHFERSRVDRGRRRLQLVLGAWLQVLHLRGRLSRRCRGGCGATLVVLRRLVHLRKINTTLNTSGVLHLLFYLFTGVRKIYKQF